MEEQPHRNRAKLIEERRAEEAEEERKRSKEVRVEEEVPDSASALVRADEDDAVARAAAAEEHRAARAAEDKRKQEAEDRETENRRREEAAAEAEHERASATSQSANTVISPPQEKEPRVNEHPARPKPPKSSSAAYNKSPKVEKHPPKPKRQKPKPKKSPLSSDEEDAIDDFVWHGKVAGAGQSRTVSEEGSHREEEAEVDPLAKTQFGLSDDEAPKHPAKQPTRTQQKQMDDARAQRDRLRSGAPPPRHGEDYDDHPVLAKAPTSKEKRQMDELRAQREQLLTNKKPPDNRSSSSSSSREDFARRKNIALHDPTSEELRQMDALRKQHDDLASGARLPSATSSSDRDSAFRGREAPSSAERYHMDEVRAQRDQLQHGDEQKYATDEGRTDDADDEREMGEKDVGEKPEMARAMTVSELMEEQERVGKSRPPPRASRTGRERFHNSLTDEEHAAIAAQEEKISLGHLTPPGSYASPSGNDVPPGGAEAEVAAAAKEATPAQEKSVPEEVAKKSSSSSSSAEESSKKSSEVVQGLIKQDDQKKKETSSSSSSSSTSESEPKPKKAPKKKAGGGDPFANWAAEYALSDEEDKEAEKSKDTSEALVRVDTKTAEEDHDAPAGKAAEKTGQQHPADRAENQDPAHEAGIHLTQTAQHMARGEFPLDAGLVMEILEGNVEIDFSVKVDGKTAQEWFDEIAETEENEEVLAEMKMAVGNPPVAHASACSVGFAGCTRSRRVSFWSPPAEQK